MTAGTKETAQDLELGPCPPWCLSLKYGGHWLSNDDSHGGAGRLVDLNTEPDIEMSDGRTRREGVLVNAWYREGSKARITISLSEGRRRHMTPDEAVVLAANLLATVDEALSGAGEKLRCFEDCRVKDHAWELLSIRRNQIRSVVPGDGEVVDGFHRFFFCAPCNDWIELSDRRKTRKEAQQHREAVHFGSVKS